PASSSLAYRPPPSVARRGLTGFTRSSTTATASWDSVGIRLLTRNGHLVTALSAHPRSHKPAQGPLLPDRRRGRGLRREGARGVRAASLQARGPPRVLVCLRPARAERQDLRLEPIETRKATFASVLRGCLPGLRLNEHLACPSCCRR